MRYGIPLALPATLLLLATAACDQSPVSPDPFVPYASVVAADGSEANTYTLVVPEGESLFINLPGDPGGGGFEGPLFHGESGRNVGNFTTDISPNAGRNIFSVLDELMATGSSSVGPVEGTFSTVSGTIIDRHFADLRVVGPGTTPGYEATVEARAVGEILEGTQKFNRDGGRSDLVLVMEVDADGLLPTRAVSGTFVFIVD